VGSAWLKSIALGFGVVLWDEPRKARPPKRGVEVLAPSGITAAGCVLR
jgi:hypothetical protein